MRTRLKPGEKMILKSQQHWIVIASPIIWTIIFLMLAQSSEFFFALAALAGVISLYKMIDRSTNIWVVTNTRVIDEQGVFSISSKETPLDKINNVSYRKSLLGRMFDYGNVIIQSAAEKGSSVHKMIQSPKKLRDTITGQQEKYKQDQIKSQASEFAKSVGQAVSSSPASSSASVADELEKLFSLKEKGIINEKEYLIQKTKILNK